MDSGGIGLWPALAGDATFDQRFGLFSWQVSKLKKGLWAARVLVGKTADIVLPRPSLGLLLYAEPLNILSMAVSCLPNFCVRVCCHFELLILLVAYAITANRVFISEMEFLWRILSDALPFWFGNAWDGLACVLERFTFGYIMLLSVFLPFVTPLPAALSLLLTWHRVF
jgi:hypothetical protein